MPNWVKNIINVSGRPSDIDAFIEKVKGERGEFDFDEIIPMPKSLNITSGNITDISILYYISDRLQKTPKEIKENPDVECLGFIFRTIEERITDCRDGIEKGNLDADELYKNGKTYVDNYHKYGAVTWYKWCNRNWGTKWNACEAEVSRISPSSCTIYFETAWSIPEPIINKMVADNSRLKFNGKWADEDLGNNCGTWTANNKVVSYDENNDARFACEIWGYEYDEENDSAVFE